MVYKNNFEILEPGVRLCVEDINIRDTRLKTVPINHVFSFLVLIMMVLFRELKKTLSVSETALNLINIQAEIKNRLFDLDNNSSSL